MSKQTPRWRSVLQDILSTLSGKAPQQNGQFTIQPKDPITDDDNMWYDYWQARGEPWRTEPEIDTKRQKKLAQLRATVPDIEHGIYPFRDIKLSRADIEWLLSTHEDGRGPVNWKDENQRRRKGLDLRGADLRNIDLSSLPLACVRGGLDWEEWRDSTKDQRHASILHLDGADLTGAHLEGAILSRANLKQTKIGYAYLENVNLHGAHLEETFLYSALLQNAYIVEAHLEKATLWAANLKGADLGYAFLEGADLYEAYLEGAFLYRSNLVGVRLCRAHLEGCFLKEAHLEKADLTEVHLEGAILRGAKLNDKKHIGPQLADVHWGDVNLTAVKWAQVEMLGDEIEARQKVKEGKKKNKILRLEEHDIAVRANRQLAIALQGQGLNEDAARFAYHAQVLQKATYWFQMVQPDIPYKQRIRALGTWLFSWFLFLLAGYGYKPRRSFLAYLLVIGTFMVLYLLLDPHLVWYEAIVVSLTAFHGRGFSPSTFSPGDPLSIASAIEAFVGLIIEVTFIATLTRRFFGQ